MMMMSDMMKSVADADTMMTLMMMMTMLMMISCHYGVLDTSIVIIIIKMYHCSVGVGLLHMSLLVEFVVA